MNLQIGDNNDNDKSNRQLMDYMVDQIDRKLNPHKYEIKHNIKEYNGGDVMVGYITMIIFVIVVAFNLIV